MTKLDEPLFTYLICQSLGNMYRYQDLSCEESLVQLKDALSIRITIRKWRTDILCSIRTREELMCIKNENG